MERGTPREGRWPLGCRSLGRDVGTLQEGDGKETLRLHALPPSAPMPSLPWAELSWKPEPKEFIGSYAATPGPRARQRGWTWRGQEDPSDLKNRDPGGISVPELELSWEQDKAEQKRMTSLGVRWPGVGDPAQIPLLAVPTAPETVTTGCQQLSASLLGGRAHGLRGATSLGSRAPTHTRDRAPSVMLPSLHTLLRAPPGSALPRPLPPRAPSLQSTFSGVPTQLCFPEPRPQVPPPFPGCVSCLVVKNPPEVLNPRMLPG